MMQQFGNCAMEPANVTLTLAPGKLTSYEVYGYALVCMIDGKRHIKLQPADLRRNPVMIVPVENIGKIVCKFE